MHPQIAAANYLALAAQEVVKETRSGYFPTANLYGTAVGANSEGTRIMAGGLNNPSVFDRAAGGLQVNQLITDFGRTANLTASSKLQAQAAEPKLELTREQVLLQVDTAYFGALEAQAVLHVAQQTVDTRQLLLDQVTALATNKLRSQLDVSFAQVEFQQARCCWKNPRTTPTPPWRRFRRRWATANFTSSNWSNNRRRRSPPPTMSPIWCRPRCPGGRNC